jgi:transcriptional regulator with XRE-family HTH domain
VGILNYKILTTLTFAVHPANAVSKIERAVANPSLEILLRLANHLETGVAELLKSA